MAKRPRSRPSIRCSSHGGRCRSIGLPCRRLTKMPSSRSSPGDGKAERRTWYSTSIAGSSIHCCSGFHSRSGVRSFRFHGASTRAWRRRSSMRCRMASGDQSRGGSNAISPATCIIISRDSPYRNSASEGVNRLPGTPRSYTSGDVRHPDTCHKQAHQSFLAAMRRSGRNSEVVSRLFLLASLLVPAAACGFSSDYTGTQYQCGVGGTCPSGFACMANVCVAGGPDLPDGAIGAPGTWRSDTAADFGAAGYSATLATVAARGAVEPFAYYTGGVLVHGSATPLGASAAATWDQVIAAPPTPGASIGRNTDVSRGGGTPKGVGLTHAAGW